MVSGTNKPTPRAHMKNNFVHRDIKPQNVFLDGNNEAKMLGSTKQMVSNVLPKDLDPFDSIRATNGETTT